MKKIGFILLLCMMSLTIQGQIQRKFFDFTLGVTNRQEVTSYFKARNIKTWLPEEDHFSVRYIRFGGNKWPVVYFYFYKNKLYLIYFSDSENFTERGTLDAVWERIKLSLMSKYNSFYNDEKTTNNELIFEDSKTRLTYYYKYYQGKKSMSLIYEDKHLLLESFIDEDDEL